jgi:dienelactone hydrolase
VRGIRGDPPRPWTRLALAGVAFLLGATVEGAAAWGDSGESHTNARSSPVDPSVGVSTAPVTPAFAETRSTFEGHPVLESIPARPRGIVYMFHGSGGGVGFVNRLETVDVLNTLVARGYGFVATDSTNRTTKQWNVTDTSLRTNRDLARMAQLRQHIVASTTVSTTTPTYGIGMSNGAAFAALWAAVSDRSTMPVDAVALYMSAPRAVVFKTGGLHVPTFMVLGQNDTRTNPAHERADLERIAAGGAPTELEEVPQRPLVAARYMRVPGVDSSTADAIVAAYRAAGIVDSQGDLMVTLPRISTARPDPFRAEVVLPSSLSTSQRHDVEDETLATIGEHQFNAEFKLQNVEFFERHRPSAS